MGNQIQKTEDQDWQFLRNLSQPITVGQPGTSSHLQIYRHRHIPTQFFLKTSSAFTADQRSQQYISLLSFFQHLDHPNIARLFHFHIRESQLVCNRQLMLDCYYGFHNFRLSDVVERKYVHRSSPAFREAQLWYIAGSILAIMGVLRNERLPMGGFTAKEFYLTTEGELKYYPNHLRRDYSHVGFLRAIKDPTAITQHYLSPQQLLSLRTITYTQQQDFSLLCSGDMYSLGMVLLECLLMQPSSQFYSVKNLDIKQQKLANKLLKVQEMPRIVEFIKRCLAVEPKERMGVEEAVRVVGRQREVERRINFFEQENKENLLPVLRENGGGKAGEVGGGTMVKLRLR